MLKDQPMFHLAQGRNDYERIGEKDIVTLETMYDKMGYIADNIWKPTVQNIISQHPSFSPSFSVRGRSWIILSSVPRLMNTFSKLLKQLAPSTTRGPIKLPVIEAGTAKPNPAEMTAWGDMMEADRLSGARSHPSWLSVSRLESNVPYGGSKRKTPRDGSQSPPSSSKSLKGSSNTVPSSRRTR